MKFADPRQDRTALRLRLYENGFTPLPNHNKACFLPEWSTVKVTPELIQTRQWARSKAWSDTGIRCGDVIAIDWDINDKALLNDLLDAVIEKGIVEESPFVRVGRPPRELWVYRTKDKIGKRTTGAFMLDEDSEEEKVEILGGGCQFAAYGYRDANTPYTWPGQNLLDARYMDLPVITLAQVEALKDFAIAFFEARGLVRKSPMAGTDGGYNHVYDLTDDMVFDVHDMGEMRLTDIEAYLRQAPETVLRCTVEALRPTSGSWAGMISLVYGMPCLSDHGTYTAHFPASLDSTDATSKLGALLSPLMEAQDTIANVALPADDDGYEALNPTEPFDLNLTRALHRFVFVKADGFVFDLGEPGMPSYPMRVFRDMLTNYYTVDFGPRGGEDITWLVDQWSRSPARRIASMAQMRPDQPWPLFVEHGVTILNTYRPPVFYGSGDPQVGVDMLERLLPYPEECRYFKQWLRYKIEHPHVPGPGIVMVANATFGTGRGSLFALLSHVFGDKYVQNIGFNTLAGRTSQSQYNEWLVDSLLVTVNEAQEVGGSSRWQSRSDAYEHLKEVVDPSHRKINVVRKGVRNSQGTSYASIIVASNHGDAFVIPKEDRRLAVLENGDPQPPEYWENFRRWLDSNANIGAFIEEIVQTDMTGYNPYVAPPMTRAKAEMIDAGASDLDRAIEETMADLPGRIVVKEQILKRLEDYLVHNASEFPPDWPRIADHMFRRATRKMLRHDRVLMDGKQRIARVLPGCPLEALESTEAVLAEVEKNGSISRAVNSGGTVVNFAAR